MGGDMIRDCGDPSFRAGRAEPLGFCHRVTLEMPIQEGSRSLATYKMMSNQVICTVALIELIMSTSYFQNLSRLAVIIMNQVDSLLANPFQALSYEEK